MFFNDINPQAKIHILSHCIHYGTGVFEGIKCYYTPKGPAVFRLREHLERLHYSANSFKMNIPFSVDTLFEGIIELIKANDESSSLKIALPVSTIAFMTFLFCLFTAIINGFCFGIEV